VGLATAGGLVEIAAGVLGTVATWVASTGSRAAGREAQTPRLVGACEKQARGFLGGAPRCLACSESPSQIFFFIRCSTRVPGRYIPHLLLGMTEIGRLPLYL
jgi:hypothetical protein